MKRIVLIVVIALLSQYQSFGQHRYIKLITKEKYEKAAKKLNEALQEDPNDVELCFAMGILLKTDGYERHDYKMSYEYFTKADSLLQSFTDEKRLRKLSEDSISHHSISCYLDTVCNLKLKQVEKVNTIKEYECYLKTFAKAPSKWIQKATDLRDNVAYAAAKDSNTVTSFENFIHSYPNAKQQKEAQAHRNALAYALVKKEDSISNYKKFISLYPDATEAKEAQERIYTIAFLEAQKRNTSKAFEQFCNEYPESEKVENAKILREHALMHETTQRDRWETYRTFIEEHPESIAVTAACDSIYSIGVREENLQALKYCVNSFEGAKRQKVLLLYHDLYTNDGELISVNNFYEEFDDEIFTDIQTKDYEIATLGNALHLEQSYDESMFKEYDEFIRLSAPNDRAFLALQRMLTPEINAKKWTSAINKMTPYASLWEKRNKHFNQLLDILKEKKDASIKVSAVGRGINSTGSEYVPVISANDKQLYFCGQYRGDNLGGEDIFVSNRTKTGWSNAKLVEGLSSVFENDAPLSITADGTTMLLFKSGMINKADKLSKGWAEAEELPESVNSASWQADAMISSDGKALLFAATRSDAFNTVTGGNGLTYYHGTNSYPSDIYVSLLDENGEWGAPINLGSKVNTRYCDRSPFLHPDMKTLYFSSNGHGGLGDLDVFKVTRLADTCWNCWSEPVNMGKDINTEKSDWGYRISTDGQTAYFSKRNDDIYKDDIYSVNIPKYLQPGMVATISGKLVDKTNQPISAEIRWEDLETGKNIGQSKSDPTDGSFFIVLPLGKIYGYFVDKKEYFPISKNIDLRKSNVPIDLGEKIDMVTFNQMVNEGTAVPVNNLFFNISESALLPYSIPELKRVAKIIKENQLKVEISGHTDNAGDDTKNQILSEQRALAVKNVLIKEGCSAELLQTVVFGRMRPVASNETEEGRAKNRRVELRFLKK